MENRVFLPTRNCDLIGFIEVACKLSVAQLGVVNHVAVPNAVQVCVSSKPLRLYLVSSLIITAAHMQRLVNISNQVNEHFQIFFFGFFIERMLFQFSNDALYCSDYISFWIFWRLIVGFSCFNRYPMP